MARRVVLGVNGWSPEGPLHCALCNWDHGDDWGRLTIDGREDRALAVCEECQDQFARLYRAHGGRGCAVVEVVLDDEEPVASYQVWHLRRVLGGDEGQALPATLVVLRAGAP